MGLQNVEFKFTGGVDGGRGWKGNVKNMLLDTSKLEGLNAPLLGLDLSTPNNRRKIPSFPEN